MTFSLAVQCAEGCAHTKNHSLADEGEGGGNSATKPPFPSNVC